MRTVALAAFACFLLGSAPSAGRAEDPADLATKARAVLEKHCYCCHGENGRAVAGVYVLNRQRLVDRKKLVPGQPEKSRLYQAVRDGEMPPADAGVKVRPGKDDLDVLRRWIAANAPDYAPVVAARTFVSESDVLASIQHDLEARGGRDRRFTRYFTLTHLYNAGISDDELQSYRHGLAKLVNSLSWGRHIVKPTPIDKAKTIFRIDLRDYEWDARTWQAILGRYPYGVTHKTLAGAYLASASGCALPYVRGDWFVFAASRPPLYHDVLGIPASDGELEKRLEVDVPANIRRDRVARAGFNASGVSRNNRLIERHVSRYGAYWKSYDFASNDGRRNLFRHPLGPAGENTFEADGGEIIFSLPNGLQGYMLVDGKGKRLDEAPVKIVSTGNRLKPEVLNGVSCMDCHARGTIFKDDQVRKAVESSASFSAQEKDTVKALYPLKAKFDELLKEDAERFRKAVQKCGDSVQKTDTVVLLAARFEEELDLKLAAAEAGLKAEELQRGLKRSARLGRALAPLLAGGTVKRDTFVEAFGDMVEDLQRGTFLAPGGLLVHGREIANSIGMRLALIPAGKFRMGSPPDEAERSGDEEQHEVEITKAFYLGVHEVTQGQFRKVMGYNPSYFSRGGRGAAGVKYDFEPAGGKDAVKDHGSMDDLPVDNVSWEEARTFLEKLSDLPDEKKAGWKYRLPTESQWEYACRGGASSSEPFNLDGKPGTSLSSKQANFDGNSPYGGAGKGEYRERTCKVGSYRPNGFGLYDMHGNVHEWCADWYARDSYAKSPRRDPPGPAEGSERVFRGGCWDSTGASCRSAYRFRYTPDYRTHILGFRAALVPPGR